LKQPLTIQGDYQLTTTSQIVAEPLLLLHFILTSINPRGNLARTSTELLAAFLLTESFVYKEVVFDLTTNELTEKYVNEANDLVKTLHLWEWAIVLHGRVLIPFGCG
jgi:hypothetical protein